MIISLVIAGIAGGEAPVTFVDVAPECGIDFTHHVPIDPPQMQKVSPGGAIGDFNNDGHQDIFVISGGSAPDALFINDGAGSFTNEAAAWGLTDLHLGMGACTGDYNNDGWLDLYVTSFGLTSDGPDTGGHRLYRNDGGTGFTNVAVEAGVNLTSRDIRDGTGAAFGDYDLDGDLDLMVCGWVDESYGNRLFRNNGDGTFTDVTGRGPITFGQSLRGFSPIFVDMNDDRYPELLIAADYGSSKYFVNNGGTFVNQTPDSGTGLDDNGMGSTVCDIDGDGKLDWYVSSIWTFLSHPQVVGTGNMLYLQDGEHTYTEHALELGAHDGGWGWGTIGIDIDHDGRVDLVENNGWDAPWTKGEFIGERAKLFHQQPDGSFIDLAEACGLEHTQDGRAVMRLDYDNDGDQDLCFLAQEGTLELHRNDCVNDLAWIRLFFDTSENDQLAPDGFGASVIASAGGSTWRRTMHGGCNYLSTSELSVHFGLGSATEVDSLRIDWPNGQVTTLTDVAVNQTMTITAPSAADLSGDGAVGMRDLLTMLANWGECPGDCPPLCVADIDADCVVGTGDLLELIEDWTH